MNALKILYLSADRGIPVRGNKGAAVHVRALSDAFARAGHDATIVTPRPGPVDGPAPRAKLCHVPLPEGCDSADAQSRAYNDVLVNATAEMLRNEKYDLIYERYSLWSDAGARLARRFDLPFVLEVNAPLCREAARYRELDDARAAARIEATQFRAATVAAVVSDELRDYVVGRGVPAERVRVLPNGVDPRSFHPAVRGGKIRKRHGLHDRIVVGFAGRVRPWHDIDTLLRAVRRLRRSNPAYHLLLVGRTPPELPERLAELGLSDAVTPTGPVPHDEVPIHLAAMDVAVSPHAPLSDFYFSPLKLYEYLACGVPTVAADIGQPAALIRHGVNGLLFPPGDDAALAERIAALQRDQAWARELAWQGADDILRHYTWDRNGAAVIRSIFGDGASTVETDSLPLLDGKLRQRLYRATRPDLARRIMRRKVPLYRPDGPEQIRQIDEIEVLKYKPGRRCVLGYEIESRRRDDGKKVRRRVIGKVFRDERGRRLDYLQQRLWENGFGPEAEDRIFVPAALGYLRKMRMQIQERTPGRTLNELVLTQPLAGLMPRVAEGVAKLHDTTALVTPGRFPLKLYVLENELENLERFTENLLADRPADAGRVQRLRGALQTWSTTLPAPERLAPIHRDFYYSQVLMDGSDVYLIDFDLLALGDPAIDVANFCAHLFFMGLDLFGEWSALAEEERIFRTAYAARRLTDATFWQRVAFYQSATYFRLLNVVAPRPGLVHLFDELFAHTRASMELVTA